MTDHTVPPIGMRMVKTAAAVLICLLVSMAVDREDMRIYSSIAALLCVQPYAEDTKRMAIQRIVGTAIGSVFGIATLLLEMARVFRVPVSRQLRGIYLPAVLPYFRSAVSLGLGLCWKSGAAAEVIGLPAGSIGEALYTAKVYFQTGDLFAWTAVIVTVSVIFERLFLRLVDAAVRKAGS